MNFLGVSEISIMPCADGVYHLGHVSYAQSETARSLHRFVVASEVFILQYIHKYMCATST